MGNRLSKIYTRTGDDGTTELGTGERVAKDSARVEAFGEVDELNSLIGVLLAEPELPAALRDRLAETQHELFDLGGELCLPGAVIIGDHHVDALERTLDLLNADLPALKDFILPGGSRAIALCHQARAVCRRAERRLVRLSHESEVRAPAQHYLNRLSDLLFVGARATAKAQGCDEVLWRHEKLRKPD